MFLLFGIISAVSFGISNTYWKTAAKKIDYPFLVFFRGVIATIFFSLLWLFFNDSSSVFPNAVNPNAGLIDYSKAFALCFTCSLGLVFFLKSMKHTPVSISVALSSVNIFGILTTVFIVGERFTSLYFFSFTLSMIGVLMCQSFSLKNFSLKWNLGATYALLASFFWGITYPLFKFVSPSVGAIPLSFILESSVMITALFWIILTNKKQQLNQFSQLMYFKHYIILASLLIGGTLFFNLAIQKLSVFNLNIIGNLQFIVSVLLSIIFYRDNLSLIQKVGLATILFAVIVTQYFI